MKEIFDEHLSLILPEGYSIERGTDPQGRALLNFHPAADAEQEIRLNLRNAGKEAELEEEKRNLKSNFHTTVTAKLGEAPGLLWTTHYLLTVVLFEHQRRCYLLSCYKAILNREELESFAAEAADYLNELFAAVSIDGATAEAEPIQARKILELAGVAEPVDESKPDEEEQRRAAEQFMREHPDGEGVSVRAVYRDPITGKMRRDLFWERAGAESGDPEAMGQMALAYMNGDGVEQNDEKALEYMRKAAEMDSATAQFNMGMFYAQARGVKRDFAQARYWLEQADDNGDGDAAGALRVIEQAEKLQAAADAGDAAAQEQFARILCTFRSEQNERDALAYAKKSAEAGCAAGMDFVGQAYEHCLGVEQDYKEAFRWYKAAAEAGHAGSQSRLACLYKRGDGVEQSDELAMMWMRKAAEQGNEFAQQTLQQEEERAARDAEYRRQIEEEGKKREKEWLKQYGGYVEKNPRIVISGSSFVFTGIATIAAREEMSAALEKMAAMGGVERAAVSGKTDYLVVDPRDAGESKVKKALEQKAKGKNVKIVLMDDFLKALGMNEKKAVPSTPEPDTTTQKQEKDKRRQEEAARLEQERKEREAKAAREAEERRKKEEAERREQERKEREAKASREAEERRKKEEAARLEQERKEREAKAAFEAEERKKKEEAERLVQEQKEREAEAAREAEERQKKEEAERKQKELENRMLAIRAELEKTEKEKDSKAASLLVRARQNEDVMNDLNRQKKRAGLLSFGKRKELSMKIQILQGVRTEIEKEKEALEAAYREEQKTLLDELHALDERLKGQ